MAVVENLDAVRRRKTQTPPPPLKPKPKLTMSMCGENIDFDDFDVRPIMADNKRETYCSFDEDRIKQQCSSDNVTDNNDDLLPKGTVKALAERFGGSSKNLYFNDAQGMKNAGHSAQTLPRQLKPVSRKVSYKHRFSTQFECGQTYSSADGGNLRKHVGIPVYGSRGNCSLHKYGSSSSLNSANSPCKRGCSRKSLVRKCISQDLKFMSCRCIADIYTRKGLHRSKSLDPNFQSRPVEVADDLSTKFTPNDSFVFRHKASPIRKLSEGSSKRGPPPPVPAKPRLFMLDRQSPSIPEENCSQLNHQMTPLRTDCLSICEQSTLPVSLRSPSIMVSQQESVYEEYDEDFRAHNSASFASNPEMVLLDNSTLELSGRIYHAVRNGVVLDSSGDCDKTEFLEATNESDQHCDAQNAGPNPEDGQVQPDVETNAVMVNSCENYAEIIYELPQVSCEKSSTNGESGISCGKKSVSSWDTTSSLASSSEITTTASSSATPSCSGFQTSKFCDQKQMISAALNNGPPLLAYGGDPTLTVSEEPRRSKTRLPRNLRAKSQTIDIDKLWRIKSDIRLNLSQAMGKIKLKVSNGRSSRDQKAKSTFYIPNASSDPASISITLEAPISGSVQSNNDDDDCSSSVSGDTWDFNVHDDDDENVAMRRHNSLANVVVGASALPDLVQHELFGIGSNKQRKPSDCQSNPPLSPFVATPSTVDFTDTNGVSDIERFEMVYSSRFAFSEPLYQHYRNENSNGVGVQRNQTFSEADARGARREKLLNSSQLGSQRTLWCELPEVQSAGLLAKLKDDERKLQEAMFEVITSEASYLRSLNILITHFMACPKLSGNTTLGSVVSRQERKRLFSNILAVRDCSENLLCNLETRLERNVILDDVCEVLIEHLNRNCEVYVKYCSNQIYQERTLNLLRSNNADFRQTLLELESSAVCESLDLRSFLMLPMQRITRYPLLAGAILHRNGETVDSDRRRTAEKSFAVASRVVKECNEGAKRWERIEQMVQLEKHLVYKEGGPKRLPLISGAHRWLIKQGPVVQIEMRRRSLGRAQTRKLYLFLFTDLLLVTKPNSDGTDKLYYVRDYCARQFLAAEPLDTNCPQIPCGATVGAGCALLQLTLMMNHRNKQTDYLLSLNSEVERNRWLDCIRPKSTNNECLDDEEKTYEIWDCPQVKCVQAYTRRQDDEMDLEFDELINVLRKLPDGWYYGERVRDTRTGWFPSTCTEEVISDHIRAKNYRQRLKLMHEAELQIQMNAGGTLSKRASGLSMAKSIFRL